MKSQESKTKKNMKMAKRIFHQTTNTFWMWLATGSTQWYLPSIKVAITYWSSLLPKLKKVMKRL